MIMTSSNSFLHESNCNKLNDNFQDPILSNQPLFTIVTACHNAELFIASTIKSVITQQERNWEMIIIDDASTDRSYEIARDFSNHDARISVHRVPSRIGPAAARNAAIDLANGRWLAILDADDLFMPNKLSEQRLIIEKYSNKSIVLISTGYIEIDANDKLLNHGSAYPTTSFGLKRGLRLGRFPPHSSVVYHTDAVRLVNKFNTNFTRAHDFDLWLRLSCEGEFGHTNKKLTAYRLHRTNISNTASDDGYSQIEYGIAARVCDRLRSSGYFDPSLDPKAFGNFMNSIALKYRQSFQGKIINLKIINDKSKIQFTSHSMHEIIKKFIVIVVYYFITRISLFSIDNSIFTSNIENLNRMGD